VTGVVLRALPTTPYALQPYISAANNACWALGLLATALPADVVAPLVATAAERMLHVLKASGSSVHRRLRENAAISVGRLATVQPSALAAHLSHFLGDWCVTLATITVRPGSCDAAVRCAARARASLHPAAHRGRAVRAHSVGCMARPLHRVNQL
jgi:hypothetical protein